MSHNKTYLNQYTIASCMQCYHLTSWVSQEREKNMLSITLISGQYFMHFAAILNYFMNILHKKVFEQYSQVPCTQKCIFQHRNLDSIAFKKKITIISRLYLFGYPLDDFNKLFFPSNGF